MLTKTIVAASLGLLLANASAQCALTVSGSGAPGTTLQFNLDGSASGAFAFLTAGLTQGTTVVNIGPLGSFTLGLVAPFVALPLGLADANGDASLSIDVPSAAAIGLDLFGQGLTAELTFTPPATVGFAFCTSNVVGFHFGL